MSLGITGMLISLLLILLLLAIAYLIGVVIGTRSAHSQKHVEEDITIRRYR